MALLPNISMPRTIAVNYNVEIRSIVDGLPIFLLSICSI